MTAQTQRVTAIQDVPVAALRPWDRNPRTISDAAFERLKRSLEAEPDMLRARPVMARPSGVVVGGNMRLRAAQALGWETVPTVYVDLTDDEAVEWALRDNRAYGENDEQAVAELLYELQTNGRDLDLTGFDTGELDRLLASVSGGTETGAMAEPKWQSRFEIVIECDSETEQEQLFERFSAEGLRCRVLTM